MLLASHPDAKAATQVPAYRRRPAPPPCAVCRRGPLGSRRPAHRLAHPSAPQDALRAGLLVGTAVSARPGKGQSCALSLTPPLSPTPPSPFPSPSPSPAPTQDALLARLLAVEVVPRAQVQAVRHPLGLVKRHVGVPRRAVRLGGDLRGVVGEGGRVLR